MKIKLVLNKGTEILKAHNIEYSREDALALLCNILEKDKLFIILNGDEDMDEELERKYLKFIEERAEKRPLQYILGYTSFMGLDFNVQEGVLIPRPDTEVLVEEVILNIDKYKYKNICDVCCGSGAIGLSIAKHSKETFVDLCDISLEAQDVTKENLNLLELKENTKFYHSDLLEFAISENKKYDVIVSNPPYIRSVVISTLMEEVKNYEPHLALDGGEDGLYFYRKITEQGLKLINNGGLLAYEIGYDQKDDVINIMKEQGFINLKAIKDFGGNDRVVLGFHP